jgi:putative DNA primase/helicase
MSLKDRILEENRERQKEGQRNGRPAHWPSGGGDEETTSLLAPGGLTDLANSRLFVRMFKKDARHCHVWKKWLVWDGCRWKLDTSGAVERLAKAVADRIWGIARTHDNTALRQHAAQTASARGINAMLSLAASDLSIDVADLDTLPFLLNCPNGTIDLKTGGLRPHRREDKVTKLCPTSFDPDADAPTWHRFLHGVFQGDGELIAFVQKLLGYCVSGDTSEHILAIAHGVGANGKSTLFETFMHVLGDDYAAKAPRDLMLARKADGHPTAVADLFGKRFVAAVETGTGKYLDESLVKEMTGGDTLRARRMREDYWQFIPTHKLLLATNHRPQIRGTDNGIWRRIRLIPFERVFTETEQDKRLAEKLRTEAAGILAWCVRGCREWQQTGLEMPAAVSTATSHYRTGEDVIGRFLAECCIRRGDIRVKFRDLFEAFESWASDNGERVSSKKAFGGYLRDHGIPDKKSGVKWCIGIGLLADEKLD